MTDRRSDGDASRGRARSLRDRLEGRLLTALAVLTSVVLVVVFYYPVGTVLIEAVVVDGAATLSVFAALLRDPFYFGELARLFAGESPLAVANAYLGPDRRLGIVGFTAYQAALSTVASVAIGLPAAYLLARFEFPGRRTLRSLTIVPFVLPSIMVAVGFVATFGTNGTLNAVLSALGLPRVDLMFTLQAVVIAHAFYNAPLVARVTTAAWESVDASAVETARSLGAGPVRAFYDVVAPQVYPAVLAGAALVGLNGVLDAIDGTLARRQGTESPAGDLLDHVLDRYADVAILAGLAAGVEQYALGFAAVTGVLLTSYLGTQIEAIGMEREYGGLVGRADRLALIAVVAVVASFDPATPVLSVVGWLLAVLAVVGHLTAVQRFAGSWRAL